MGEKRRFNILLGTEDEKRIKKIALSEGVSVGALVRKMVLNWYSMDEGKRPICANGETCLALDRWQKQRGGNV